MDVIMSQVPFAVWQVVLRHDYKFSIMNGKQFSEAQEVVKTKQKHTQRSQKGISRKMLIPEQRHRV